MELLEPTKHSVKYNQTQEEKSALQEITSRDDIIIKRADKGGKFVIMNKDFYRDKLVLGPVYMRKSNRFEISHRCDFWPESLFCVAFT